ncbi:MAG: hypothetical protein KAV00_16600, partial [Phycisphaerae bacterium]|nr:hypothetical protein [Phycisphaerae bacterium]
QVGDFFPEVAQRAEQVDEVILEEESSFNRTLDRGILIFERSMIDAICWKLSDERKSPTWEAERSGLIKKSTDEVPWVFKIGSEEFVLEKKADTANFVRKYCKSAPQISGPTAFELYATYGFPIDLTQLMASERGLSVDIDGYEREMENHREISRVQSTLLTSDYQQPGGKTEFCGYKDEEVEQIDTHVLATRKKERGKLTSHVLSEGDEGIVFLDKSPFYAEAGGQVGDTGIIEQDSGTFRVTDTRKEVPAPGIENYCHYGVVEKGQIQIRNKPVRRSKPPGSGKELPPPGISGDAIARVDKERRQDIARNHTATHLLNWALRKVLEGNIDQAGSVVAPERLRFDFTYSKAVTAEQLAEVERLVNGRILADEAIFTNDIPLAQAQKIPGVRAVFGEKYPDPVRVVSVAVDDPVKQGDENTLVEFCGGTHLERTSQAGFFKILSEESVAKGVRRITAVTGHQAVRHIQRLDEAVSSASSALRVPIEQISERIIAMQSEIKQLRKGRSAKQAGGGQFKPDFVVKTPEGDALIGSVDFADAGAMRKICDVQRQKGAAAILLGGTAENKVMLVAMVSESLVKTGGIKAGEWVNAAATVVGGKGGGKPTMAQAGGKDAGKLPEALKVGADWLQGKLG